LPLFDHFKLLAPIYEFFIKPKQPEELVAHMGLSAEGALLDAEAGLCALLIGVGTFGVASA